MEHDMERVKQQQEAVRRSGKTNMFDVSTVQRIAFEADFHDLVVWIDQHEDSEYLAMASEAAEEYRDEDLEFEV